MASRQRHQKAGLDGQPPDNLPLRIQLIEQYVPHLSLADLEAVHHAINRRWQELQAAQQHAALEAHYAHLRALPAGALLQVVFPPPGFAAGDSVTIERPLRPPSTNIRVYDGHGKPWHFPMECLVSETEEASIHTVLRKAADARGGEAARRFLERLAEVRELHR